MATPVYDITLTQMEVDAIVAALGDATRTYRDETEYVAALTVVKAQARPSNARIAEVSR